MPVSVGLTGFNLKREPCSNTVPFFMRGLQDETLCAGPVVGRCAGGYDNRGHPNADGLRVV